MRSWKQEMELEENMSREEINRFLEIIEKSGIPSIEEYADKRNRDDAQGEYYDRWHGPYSWWNRDDVQDEYWDKYGDTIRAAKDEAVK